MNTPYAYPETLSQAIRAFADPDRALSFLAQLRWPNGAICAHCGADSPIFLKTRRIWKCRACKKQFSVKLGTIFEDSALGLDKWLPALWMIANAKNGISSYELHRALGVTQKSAWFMLHRIRLAMQTASFAKFEGEVEVDESFIGGKAGNMHKGKRERVQAHPQKAKTAVVGILKRGPKGGSRVRAAVKANVRKGTLQSHVRANVEAGSAIFTDAHPSYTGLDEDFAHEVIDHKIAYVRGRVHTNGLENFWSLFKRTLKGTYVSVDPFHLVRYLHEQVYRFNARKHTDGERFRDVMREIVGKRLTYTRLIGRDLSSATT